MNKTFKTIWNSARGNYVVASESQKTHGKPSHKKLIVAMAVTAAVMGATSLAQADTRVIDNAALKQEGTTKLISGQGKGLSIQTNGDLRKLAAAIGSKDLGALRAALGYDGTYSTLVGVAGGNNIIDSTTNSTLTLARIGLRNHKTLQDLITKVKGQLKSIKNKETFSSNSSVVIGSDDSKPLIVGITGSDNVVNAGFTFQLADVGSAAPSPNKFETTSLNISRNGDVSIVANNGNILGLIAGSSAINVQGLNALKNKVEVPLFGNKDIYLRANASETSHTLKGNTNVYLNNNTTTLGGTVGSVAIALGGKSTATIEGNTNLTIDTTSQGQGFEGISMGIFGGGLAGATMGGEANASVGDTTIILKNGVTSGIFGGGAALSAEIDGIWYPIYTVMHKKLEKFQADVTMDDGLAQKGGTATSTSGNIVITASNKTATAAVAGGGFAWANSGASASQDKATVSAESVTLTLGEAGGQNISEEQKLSLHKNVPAIYTLLASAAAGKNISANLEKYLKQGEDIINGCNVPGAHMGNVGGSIVLSRFGGGAGSTSTAEATGTVKTVTMNLVSGYNAFNLAGGLSIGIDGNGSATDNRLSATSSVDEANINILGGENLFVMGGGASYATGNKGYTSTVNATSKVGTSNVTVAGGSVDGIYGGGLAIDDTNASATNAKASVDKVNITIADGTVNAANVDPITNIGAAGSSSQAPSNRTYLREAAKLVSGNKKDSGGNVAILSGGMATGSHALASVGEASVTLTGGKITGNVFGGGAATLGASTTVGTSTITVNGAEVNADIYAGGLAGSPDNEKFSNYADYAKASSTVDTAKIVLADGKVTGDVYAGGFLHENSPSASVTVKSADIYVQDDVFQGSKIVGEGADKSALVLAGTRDFTKEDGSVVALSGFDTVTSSGELSGLTYTTGIEGQGGKNTTLISDYITFNKLTAESGLSVTVGNSDTASLVGTKELLGSGSFLVTKGMLAVGNSDDILQTAQSASAANNVKQDVVLYVSGSVDGSIGVGTEAASKGLTVKNGAVLADADGNTSVAGNTSFDANSSLYFVNVGIKGTEQKVGMTLSSDKEPTNVTLDNVFWTYNYDQGTYTLSEKSKEDIASSTGVTSGDVIAFYNRLGADEVLRQRIAEGTFRGEANLKGGMNLAAAAGVQSAALQGLAMATDEAQKRASLSQTFVNGATGFAEISGTRLDMGGNSSMNEINADLGGVIVGGEWTKDDVTIGALANVGTGSVRGQSANSGVKNDVNYYGASVYAGKRFGNFNLVGQAGYQRSDNDLTDSSIGYAKADGVKTDAWTIGVRGETSYAMSAQCRAIPYVGLIYVRLHTDDYTVSNGTHVSSTSQNLWTVPVGVMFTGNLDTTSGWSVQPLVDVAYVGAFGDRDVKATTTVGSTSGAVGMDVWSENALRTRFGVEATKGNLSVGAQLGAAWGSDDMNSVFSQVSARYHF